MSELHRQRFVTMVQVSDAHVRRRGEVDHDGVDTARALERVMRGLVESEVPIDAVIFSGDLVDDGAPESYARFQEVVRPAMESLGAALIAVPGNHDSADGVRAVLGMPHDSGTVDTVTDVRGVSIIGLDTSRPGREEGDLDPSQLSWLADRLGEAGPGGAIVVLHHPPFTVPVGPGIDIGLDRAEALADVLRGSPARLVLAGHVHFAGAAEVGGIPAWIGGAVCSNTVRLVPGMRAIESHLVSRIDLALEAAGGYFACAIPLGRERVLREIAPQHLRLRD